MTILSLFTLIQTLEKTMKPLDQDSNHGGANSQSLDNNIDDQDLKAQVLECFHNREELGDFIPWMINSGALINASINFKDKTSDIMQPWKNNIFKMLFQSQWWGPKGEICMLCKVECALLGTINNKLVEFSENSFAPRWEHLNLIQEFRECSPTHLASVFGDIEEFVWGGPSTLALSESSYPIFDFNDLEEAAMSFKQ
ncbi:hypothetical protein SERLADRAFT_405907 [Serpula lacrymans var. lacrymans S7.9]|uniref:Uncharacterized protein n=1 Tax=Serpula lacrymans var. lacrymans (strain S7.9) TaxID=578457 RepID=F8NK11_SERL9|nr:uncharacterized protein SERLADRAFT_405907 [Serpula lacrymans var. lacrymans S7.9]EGO28323.1 hypothetical protein SERLADRAFT_405907 [Serpula lacrymans var. lacrymans S7.9]